MSALTDLYIDNAYPSLLHSNSVELPALGQEDIYDGNGNKSSLKVGRACNGATICGGLTVDTLVVTDPSSVMALLLDLLYPINSLYLTSDNINPTTRLGGIWESVAAGRFLAGQGTATDINLTNGTLNQYGGEYTHLLTSSEMPAHTHTGITYSVYAGGGTRAVPLLNGITSIDHEGAGHTGKSGTGKSGFPDSEVNLNNTGGGLPHNNVPPYFGIFIWTRTA